MFVAIYPPRDLQRRLWLLGDDVDGSWKREPPEKLHITIKFIGEVDEKRAELIGEALKSIKEDPFEIEVVGVGTFPESGSPRVIWVGVRGGGLFRLHERVEEALVELGVPRETRDFTPHITLGRAKGKVNVEPFLKKHRNRHFGTFQVKEFYLVKSLLEPTGSRYITVRRYSLED